MGWRRKANDIAGSTNCSRGIRAVVIADRRPNLGGRGLDDIVAERGADLVITAGDLHPSDLLGIGALTVPVLGVYGNHCNGRYFGDLGIIDLHLSKVDVAGITFTGLQGCVRYKDGTRDLLYTQTEYAALVDQLPAAEVVVTHCPPAGINDHPRDPAHVGIDALRAWIDTHTPRVLIHGHTYPRPPVTACGPTRIEYVHGARIVAL
jgi:uncharacterized protein